MFARIDAEKMYETCVLFTQRVIIDAKLKKEREERRSLREVPAIFEDIRI